MHQRIEKINNYITPLLELKFTESQRKLYNEILTKCAGQFMTHDISLGFMILFSYDYFYIIHEFIRDLIENHKINVTLLNELKNKILE